MKKLLNMSKIEPDDISKINKLINDELNSIDYILLKEYAFIGLLTIDLNKFRDKILKEKDKK